MSAVQASPPVLRQAYLRWGYAAHTPDGVSGGVSMTTVAEPPESSKNLSEIVTLPMMLIAMATRNARASNNRVFMGHLRGQCNTKDSSMCQIAGRN